MDTITPIESADIPLSTWHALDTAEVLIYMLLSAGLITLLLGHLIDSGVIFGVVFINAVIGYLQEGKAERAMEAIRAVAECQATGIQVKMITGDHAVTAAAIGAQLGIGDRQTVITGAAKKGLVAPRSCAEQ